MELKQIITDAKKEAAENDKFLRHWQSEHDKLQLVDIEYVVLCLHFFFQQLTVLPAKTTKTTRKAMRVKNSQASHRKEQLRE